ncbi:MAG: hypothetical protein K9G76_11755, partial [Bacteroidales bacterium]|nr:hypothetical protein [Bacteroidales bacterium]MCF8405076.1 hypothetical protein [Bacteroidales bacterium]
MRKQISLFMVLVFLLAGSLFAGNITVELPQIPSPGGTITVPLTITAIDDGILTFQAYVQYDPAVLTYVSTAYPNPQFPQIEWVTGVNVAGDEWGTNWFGSDFMPEFVTAPTVLCEITFTYLGGDTELNWGLVADKAPVKGQTLFFDPFFGTFNATLIDGCVAGSCCCGTYEWTGFEDNDWDNPNNWFVGAVPTSVNDVVIPVTSNDPIIYGSAATAAMQVDFGVMVTIDAGASLTTNGMLTNDGILFVD